MHRQPRQRDRDETADGQAPPQDVRAWSRLVQQAAETIFNDLTPRTGNLLR